MTIYSAGTTIQVVIVLTKCSYDIASLRQCYAKWQLAFCGQLRHIHVGRECKVQLQMTLQQPSSVSIQPTLSAIASQVQLPNVGNFHL